MAGQYSHDWVCTVFHVSATTPQVLLNQQTGSCPERKNCVLCLWQHPARAKQNEGSLQWFNAEDVCCLQLQDQAQEAALRGVEALEAATGVSRGSADQMEEDEEDEIDDEIDPDDEDEELAMQQPPVHDVHVSSEAVVAAGTSGQDRVPDPSRLVNLQPHTMARPLYTPAWLQSLML